MIARLLAGLALPFLLSAAAAPDWTRTVRATPAGGRLVGSPAARVKLTAFVAYTCPHCAHFFRDAAAPIAQAIRGGRLAVDYRPVVFDQIGLAATVVARCIPAARFAAVNDALYARQDDWYRQARGFLDTNAGEFSRYSALDQLQQLAVQGGIGAVAGLSAAQTSACFANPRLVADTARATDAAGAAVRATPTFILSGQTLEGLTWAQLSPKLRAAGSQ